LTYYILDQTTVGRYNDRAEQHGNRLLKMNYIELEWKGIGMEWNWNGIGMELEWNLGNYY